MRALVLCGFCISPGLHAKTGEVVDLPDGLYRDMLYRGSVEPAPAEPVKAEPAAKSEPKSK